MGIMSDTNYLKDVREQYENLPYPERNPIDEEKRLLETSLDFLPRLNHYCFSGKRNFNKGFNVLVAGGGTGDALVYLAEQLRNVKKAKITYVDLSTSSMDIAKERAKTRGLNNIDWINSSLLDLNKEQHGTFDYINCSGVLHHLESPSNGLKALKSVLSNDGAMGIMVYAKYGRTGVYQIQKLLNLVNHENNSISTKIDNAKVLLADLPESNWFNRAKELHTDHERYGDIGLYDLFLHSQDRAYSIPELFDWLSEAGVHFYGFANSALDYDPRRVIKDKGLVENILKRPKEVQYAITELVSGNIIKHTFYCGGAKKSIAKLSGEMYPVFADKLLLKNILMNMNESVYGNEYAFKNNAVNFSIPVNPITHAIFTYMDGKHSYDQILKLASVKSKVHKKDIKEKLYQLSELLIECDFLYLSDSKLN